MSSSYRLELDKWLNQLDVKADSVLDIGGSQLPVKGRTKSWSVNEYTIADLPQPHKNSPQPDIEIDLNKDNHDEVSVWDVVFCLEVFDYIWNPVHALQLISDCLKIGGTAWISFPFVYPTHQPIENDSLRYTEYGIRQMADHVGLKVGQMIRRKAEDYQGLDTWYRTERMRAAKHYDHNVTGWIVEFSS